MTMSLSKSVLTAAALAAAIGLFLTCSPARADTNQVHVDRVDPNRETTTRVVRFGDLDTNSAYGAKHLFLRLTLAGQVVCGDATQAVDLAERGDILRCQQKAVEDAVERIDRPRLTAIYDQRFPHEPAIVSASLPDSSRG